MSTLTLHTSETVVISMRDFTSNISAPWRQLEIIVIDKAGSEFRVGICMPANAMPKLDLRPEKVDVQHSDVKVTNECATAA